MFGLGNVSRQEAKEGDVGDAVMEQVLSQLTDKICSISPWALQGRPSLTRTGDPAICVMQSITPTPR
ncbi:hypothetical protein GJ744_012218 [Endocarpon pusillum]|uniref:Uncharacterized protein n=1 Tax=Endocarpon pusillum TaxID=364733 RepID=A0A8H7E0K0_9EURO|nr:hypothetical protein GJ744_012218 [Endocarpon pusillum]